MNVLTPKYEKWGKTVKKTLIDKDMRTKELAASISMSVFTVTRAITGNRPSKKAAKLISEYLGIPEP